MIKTDIIGTLKRISILREFDFFSEWTQKIETKEIINLWVESTRMEYGEPLPYEEHIVLFGNEAIQADEDFQHMNEEGVKALKEINVYFKECKRRKDKTGNYYPSWSGKEYNIITKAKKLNMLNHFHATPTAA